MKKKDYQNKKLFTLDMEASCILVLLKLLQLECVLQAAFYILLVLGIVPGRCVHKLLYPRGMVQRSQRGNAA